jgi:uncharacterized protein
VRYRDPVTVPVEIARSKYVSLTTYRRDGSAVATPVWAVVSGAELWIVSEAASGKVKRIRNDSRVVVTVCNVRGTIAPGAPSATGTARLLDDDGVRTARALLGRRYVMSRVGNGVARLLRLRRPPMAAIAVSF